MNRRLITFILALSLVGNAVAGLRWYEQSLRNRTTDAELERAITLTKETLAEKAATHPDEDSAVRYVVPLIEPTRVVGRMEASGYKDPSCRSVMSEAADAAQLVVEKGPKNRGWLQTYISQADGDCVGQ